MLIYPSITLILYIYIYIYIYIYTLFSMSPMPLQDLHLIWAALMGYEKAKLSGKGWKNLEMDIKKMSLFGDT